MKKLLHTTEHIIGQVLDDLCKGFKTTSLDIRDDSVRYDFKVKEMPNEVTKKLLEDKVNAIIAEELPVESEMTTREEAKDRGIDLSIVPDSVNEIQLVKVGNFNTQACAGEHVKNTKEISEIGKFKITKFEKKGKNSYQIIGIISHKNMIHHVPVKMKMSTSDLILSNNKTMKNKKSNQKLTTNNRQLSTLPYKGARDFYPEDIRLRNYIFDIWKKVCKRYGFEEYDFPIMEPFEIFAAKTGEEIVKEQMFTLTDRGGRKLAIRPELTPGTVRLIAQKYNELTKPIKWFMIGDNWRAEKPQKGRGREFYQLEMNVFGIEGVEADFEIFSAMIDILKEFGAKENMFKIFYNDRRLISALLNDVLKLEKDIQADVRRQMDKREKISKEEFFNSLKEFNLSNSQIEKIEDFMKSDLKSITKVIPEEILDKNAGYNAMTELIGMLRENDLLKYCEFNPGIVRGFDYSDGLVYEVFDMSPKNNRSMFGGERFDKLIKIFDEKYDMPSTGFAMGDYTLIEFLKAWKLLPTLPIETEVLVTSFSEELKDDSYKIAQKLRSKGINTFLYAIADKLDKQFKYADRMGIPYVLVIGPDEAKRGTVMLKDMKSKKQKEMKLEEAIRQLKD
jgi:histidyl-tRNA synthetase